MPIFDVQVQADIPEDEIIQYCKKHLYPGDVFSEKELMDWAEENGYVKKEL